MPTADQIYNEGDKLRDAGQYEAAVEKFEQCLQLDEKHVLAHLALAVVYVKLNRHDDAVKHGERACELDPNDPLTFTTMSVTYQRALAATGDMRFMKLAEDARDRAHAIQAGH